MKNKNDALALTSAIQPPPRKEDIINAMVQRAFAKHEEEKARLTKLRDEAEEKFKTALLDELKKHPENFDVCVHNYSKPEVEYTISVIPPAITKLKEAIRQVPTIRHFDEVAVKRQIREGMNSAGDRVKALLNNPDAVKKLDAALEAISTKK